MEMITKVNKQIEKVILAGDMGGTKTELAIFRVSKKGLAGEIFSSTYINRDFETPENLLKEFFKKADFPATSLSATVFGVAAPVHEGRRTALTNIDWTIETDEFQGLFGLKNFKLINDMAANAYGISVLGDEDFFTLNKGVKRLGNSAIISPGTGLGEAIIYLDGETRKPIATEGGHADFAPVNTVHIGLYCFLREKYGHVSYERILSGLGIKNIFDFLASYDEVSKNVTKRLDKGEDPALVISTEAMGDKESGVCKESMKLFVSILGAEAGNLVLKSMATGGLFIGGGIAPKILDILKGEDFLKAFTAKGRFKNFLFEVPVKVILNNRTALLGAAKYGADIINSK
ncbi:MAG: glucokinase [Deltaproteobacteria bacterium]|nr:glucokinase [Deltaproteobacteria bacterium]